MNEKQAKPGDVIKITENESPFKGKNFTVIECPDAYKGSSYDRPDSVWIDTINRGKMVFFDYSGKNWFKIVQSEPIV